MINITLFLLVLISIVFIYVVGVSLEILAAIPIYLCVSFIIINIKPVNYWEYCICK